MSFICLFCLWDGQSVQKQIYKYMLFFYFTDLCYVVKTCKVGFTLISHKIYKKLLILTTEVVVIISI